MSTWIPVRVIEYLVKGRGESERIRLITAILDPQLTPADTLAALYQQRREDELVFDEIKTHQMHQYRGPGHRHPGTGAAENAYSDPAPSGSAESPSATLR